jgi:ribosome-associated toxin RatA of RatAB toxin-antitoxin module
MTMSAARPRLNVLIACCTVFSLLGCATAPVPEHVRFLGYDGQVNVHTKRIHAPPSRIFAVLTDFDQFTPIVPATHIRVTKITPGPVGVGTLTRTETAFKIKVRWHSQVVEARTDQLLVSRFLDGIFQGGYEIWELQPEGDETWVRHTIVFNISNIPYSLLWTLKGGEDKHNALVEATLSNLKQCCERAPELHSKAIQLIPPQAAGDSPLR